MVSTGTSSSRTIVDGNPTKRPVREESPINLDGLEIPDMNSCHSFDFMDEDDLLPEHLGNPPAPPPLSPKTVSEREKMLREGLELGKVEFSKKPNMDYVSHS